ncbi:MAG TPA: choice-of-anchor Q domain-containing protein [Rhodothermales bacterium]|nr:choice-of-anchor Q domain-containing protein [Rhodothermales bacterium]
MTSPTRFACLVALMLLAVPAQAQSNNQIANQGTSAPTIAFSLIEDGLPAGATDGGNNATTNPLFVDASGSDNRFGTLDDNLRLQPNSPAIDAGDNAALPAGSNDLDGHPRIFDGGSGTATVDLGAYEYGAAAVGIEGASDDLPESYVLTAAYPNPFNPQTTLQFGVQHAQPVRIALYDALGREHRLLYEGTPAPGQMQTLRIDGSDLPSGLYFVRLTGDDFYATRPITLVR